jgi:phosphoribosylformylglycinamidine (FGAM) synthase-like enzyme
LEHTAILDNFCWCSSNDRERLGELVDSLKACYKFAVGFGTPFISGKDSMFNDFKGYDAKGKPIKISIPPTLLISSISVMPDLYKATTPEFKNSGDVVYLLGETNDELGASEYYKLLAEGSGKIGSNVPEVNLEKNIKTYKIVESLIEQGLVASAMSVTSGGLGVALVKASVGGMLGVNIDVQNLEGSAQSPEARLFSESQGRILVSVSPRKVKDFEKITKKSAVKLGKVSADNKVMIVSGKEALVKTDVKKLYNAYHQFSKSMQ